uniref:DUF4365 domain-containing protein n=1 Tax=Bosea sp. NBC_00436 TaxID=2969620 RepID=A0A9E7ZTK9_9HYPH
MTKKSASTRDVGELGQDHFKVWCTDNGLSAVSAKPDRFGWDFFVEFEPEIDADVPLDSQGDLIKALVQVKATESSSSPRSVRVKLSALKRLIDTHLPAFLAHLEYRPGQQRPIRARLLHIGPTQIEQILKKIRQTEKEGRIDINNVKMSLPLDEAVEIAPEATNLRDLIRSVCLSSPEEYAATKAALRKSCGYDRHSVTASFSLAEGVGEDAMVDLMLGYVPHLPINGMTVTQSRFGITLDKDIKRVGSGQMSVEVKPFQRGRIAVVVPGSNHRPVLDIDVFSPGIPWLSEGARRIRLKNLFLDISLHFGKGVCKVRFNIDPELRMPIERLADALAFGVAMSEPGAILEYEIKPILTSKITLTDDFRPYRSWRTLYEFVDMLSVALFRYRRGQVVEVSLREMSEALENSRNMFAAFTRPGVELTFQILEEPPGALPSERAIYMPIFIEFGTLAYHAVVKANASGVREDERTFRLVGEKPVVVEDGVVERSKLTVEVLNERASEIGRAASGRDRLIVTTTIDFTDEDEE